MRKPHSRDWWRTTVANWQASGQTAAAFAKPLDVDAKSLQWWQQWLRREAAKSKRQTARFIEVEVTVPAAPKGAPALVAATAPRTLAARVGAVHFEMAVGTDPAYLATLFAAVGRAVAPC